MTIRTLLFDLGNVLVHFSHDRMCMQIADLCGVPDAKIREILFDNKLQRRFEEGKFSEVEFHRVIETAVRHPVDFEALKRAASNIFELNEPLVPLLDRWKRAGYRLVLLSNTCSAHYEWVRDHFDVLQRFDDLVMSFRVGAVKPDESIFRSALNAIDCAPAECFYTDDIAAYVERGRSFGLDAELFTTVPTLVWHLTRRGVNCGDVLSEPPATT